MIDKRKAEKQLEILVGPWTGGADNDEFYHLFIGIDSDSEAVIKSIIKRDLVPRFKKLSSGERLACLEALDFLASQPTFDLVDFWESTLPPFDLPKDPFLFIKWMSEVLRNQA